MAEPDTIDCITPTRRPEDRLVMYQRWRTLLFLHWEVPAPGCSRGCCRPG